MQQFYNLHVSFEMLLCKEVIIICIQLGAKATMLGENNELGPSMQKSW